MTILKDHSHRVHFPQNLLKPKFICYNKKDTVSINFKVTFFFVVPGKKFLHVDLKLIAYIDTTSAKEDTDT